MKNTTDTTIYLTLKNKLIEEISCGSINDRLLPERKLAEKYKISRQTVNRVMVELEKEGYVTRRIGRGTFIAPHDKTVIQDNEMKPRTSGDIIIAYHDFFSYFIWENVHHAELLALRNNVNLINVKLQRESTLQSVTKIVEQSSNLLGIILMTHGDNIPVQIMQQMDRYNIPVVFSGDIAPSGPYEHVYTVNSDHYKSGYLKMNHLIQKGHRKIGIAFNEPNSIPGNENIKGMKQALYDNGMRWKDAVQSDIRPELWDDPVEAGYNQTKNILKNRDLTGLVYDTISGAFGGLRAFGETGIKCPDDVSIVTAMSLMNLERMMYPALSTVCVSAEDIIQTAYDVILSPGKHVAKKYTIDVKLIERESVKSI